MGVPVGEVASVGRVLVVDDELSVRRILDKLLSAEGYEVLLASDGQQALEILDQHTVDTILLDVWMPSMNGLEVCRRLRASPRTRYTPVVFVTAASDKPFRREARQAGADDFLTKPFDDVELLARVHNTVRVKLYYDAMARERRELARTVDTQTRELQETIARLEQTLAELERARHETLERLTKAAEFRDDETAAHLQRMSHFCRVLARGKGLGAELSDLLQIASPMHDVGKIGIPDRILLKPGRLTPEEFEIMKQHAEIGFRILSGSDSPLLTLAASIARTHHERWDGTGYPRGLRATEIPIEGRIAAVADVFDALTSRRPYKPPWTVEDALDLLRDGRGRHFDPELVDLFVESLDEILEIRERFRDEPLGD